MDLRQLAALVAVADHGTFVAAAKALHTVQSNVSAHISRLERELGVTLVDRARGELTQEGAAVVARARRVQSELDALEADVASVGQEVAGLVRFGVIGSTARWLVPRVLVAMRDAHPKVRAIVREATSSSLLPQLEGGALELAVVNLPVDAPDLVVEPLFLERFVLIAPDDHPLAGREQVHLAELAAHALLLSPQGTSLRDELDAEAARAGVTLLPLAEIDGMRLIASLAFEGFGPAILPATAVPEWLEGRWGRIEIAELAPRQVGLARRRRGLLSAPGRALRDVLTRLVANEVGADPDIHPLVERTR